MTRKWLNRLFGQAQAVWQFLPFPGYVWWLHSVNRKSMFEYLQNVFFSIILNVMRCEGCQKTAFLIRITAICSNLLIFDPWLQTTFFQQY